MYLIKNIKCCGTLTYCNLCLNDIKPECTQIQINDSKMQIRRSWLRGTKYDCKIDWLWIRSPLEEVKYLITFIFSFLRSGVEAKRGVEFRHSARNASRNRRKVGNGMA